MYFINTLNQSDCSTTMFFFPPYVIMFFVAGAIEVASHSFLCTITLVVVAQGRLCAQPHRSVLKRTDLLLLFPTSCVLVLCQDPAPRPKMVERRVVGGRIHDSWSMKPRIRNAHLLITRAADPCVKLLAVLQISSAQGRSADRTPAGSS